MATTSSCALVSQNVSSVESFWRGSMNCCAAEAPQLAMRAMLREFYAQFAATQTPPAILRRMWDALAPDGMARERDARQEEVDNRVLKWMASEGVVDDELFWDLRKIMNGRQGHTFDAFWDEMASFLELEVGAAAHGRRAAEAEDVTYASKVHLDRLPVPSV